MKSIGELVMNLSFCSQGKIEWSFKAVFQDFLKNRPKWSEKQKSILSAGSRLKIAGLNPHFGQVQKLLLGSGPIH